MLLASNQKKEANDIVEQLTSFLSNSCPILLPKLIAKASAAGLPFAERLVASSLSPLSKTGDLPDTSQPITSNMSQKKPTNYRLSTKLRSSLQSQGLGALASIAKIQNSKLTSQQIESEVHLLYKALTLGDPRNTDDDVGNLTITEMRRKPFKMEKNMLTEQEEKRQATLLKMTRLLKEKIRPNFLLDVGHIALKFSFFDVTDGCIEALEKYTRENNIKAFSSKAELDFLRYMTLASKYASRGNREKDAGYKDFHMVLQSCMKTLEKLTFMEDDIETLQVHWFLAKCYADQDLFEEAFRELSKARSLDDNLKYSDSMDHFAICLNSRTMLYTKSTNPVGQARQLIEHVVATVMFPKRTICSFSCFNFKTDGNGALPDENANSVGFNSPALRSLLVEAGAILAPGKFKELLRFSEGISNAVADRRGRSGTGLTAPLQDVNKKLLEFRENWEKTEAILENDIQSTDETDPLEKEESSKSYSKHQRLLAVQTSLPNDSTIPRTNWLGPDYLVSSHELDVLRAEVEVHCIRYACILNLVRDIAAVLEDSQNHPHVIRGSPRSFDPRPSNETRNEDEMCLKNYSDWLGDLCVQAITNIESASEIATHLGLPQLPNVWIWYWNGIDTLRRFCDSQKIFRSLQSGLEANLGLRRCCLLPLQLITNMTNRLAEITLQKWYARKEIPVQKPQPSTRKQAVKAVDLVPAEAIESLKSTNAQIQSTLAFIVLAVDNLLQQPSFLTKRQVITSVLAPCSPSPQPSIHSLDRMIWSCLTIRQLLPGLPMVGDFNSDAYFAPNLELSDSAVTTGLLRFIRTVANVWALILTNEEKVQSGWRNFLMGENSSPADVGPGRLLPPFRDTALGMMKGTFPPAVASQTTTSTPTSDISLADFCAELRLWIGLAEVAFASPSLQWAIDEVRSSVHQRLAQQTVEVRQHTQVAYWLARLEIISAAAVVAAADAKYTGSRVTISANKRAPSKQPQLLVPTETEEIATLQGQNTEVANSATTAVALTKTSAMIAEERLSRAIWLVHCRLCFNRGSLSVSRDCSSNEVSNEELESAARLRRSIYLTYFDTSKEPLEVRLQFLDRALRSLPRTHIRRKLLITLIIGRAQLDQPVESLMYLLKYTSCLRPTCSAYITMASQLNEHDFIAAYSVTLLTEKRSETLN
ncbi:hypothetical protein SprV_0100226300 [Sparganum proliferum]